METSSVIVVASASEAEQLLLAGDIGCPGCNAALRPHGHGRTRTVRGVGAQRVTHTPRRARCGDCGRTQILLPTELTVRRADTTEAIGNALVAKANGAGHRTIAAGLDRPASTVRRWLRGARGAHAEWLYQQGVQKVVAVDRDLLTRLAPQRTPLGWALNTLIGAAVQLPARTRADLPAVVVDRVVHPWAADRTESADLKSGPALSLRALSRSSPCRRTLHRSPRPASLRDDRRHRADQTRKIHPHSR